MEKIGYSFISFSDLALTYFLRFRTKIDNNAKLSSIINGLPLLEVKHKQVPCFARAFSSFVGHYLSACGSDKTLYLDLYQHVNPAVVSI
jgi:hypothetical protein